MKAHWPISILSTLSSLVSMALPLILVRALDPSLLGSFKIFFLYLMVLPPLTFIAGVSSGLSYWAGRGEEGLKAIRVSAILFLIISFLALGLMLTFQLPLAQSLHLDSEWVTLFAYALFFGIASMFYDDAAIATGRIWTGALFNSGFELLRTGTIVLTAIYTHDLFAIIRAHIFIQMLKTVSGYALAYHQNLFRFAWDPAVFRSVAKYAFPVSLAFVFGLGLNYSDQIILSKSISSAEFALYTVCCLTVPPLMILEASVTRVLIPQLSKAFAEEKNSEASALFKKAVNELGFLIIPAVVGMMVFAAPIIELLFTRKYLGGTHYLRLYSLWYLTLLLPPDSVARARGQAKWILANFICFSVITLGLCFGFGIKFGAVGVLSGLLIARFSSRLYTIYYIRTTLRWRLRDFIPFPSLAKMGVVCCILGTLSLLTRPLFHSPLAWFFTCGALFSVVYFALTLSLISSGTKSEQKVLMLTPGLYIGGLERMILNLSKSLKESSTWQASVLAYDFAPNFETKSDLISSFERHGIPVTRHAKPGRFSLNTVRQIAKHVSQNGVSVIHTHDLGALIYGALAKLFVFGQIRLVHTQHSFVHLNRSWKYRYYEKFFTLFADSIAVVSPDTHQSYRNLGVASHKLHVIPNGVDFPASPSRHTERVEMRKQLIENSPFAQVLEGQIHHFWILYLARVHGRKGQDHALSIWGKLSPEVRVRATLIFVGPETETGERARIAEKIGLSQNLEQVILWGPSQNPHDWIRASDLFLSCSEFEGMPLAPIEAVGSGLPTVLSKIPGHEFLKNYATLYALESPASGAQAIEAAIKSTEQDELKFRTQLWEKSAAIRSDFTLMNMSRSYTKLYESRST